MKSCLRTFTIIAISVFVSNYSYSHISEGYGCINVLSDGTSCIVVLGASDYDFSDFGVNLSRTALFVSVSPPDARPFSINLLDDNGDGFMDAQLCFYNSDLVAAGFGSMPSSGILHIREDNVAETLHSGIIISLEYNCNEPPPPTPGDGGCTPGYWKNHPDSWGPAGYSPLQTLESVFNIPASIGLGGNTLMEGLQFNGGSGVTGAARILLRAAVAALLNASHPDVGYPYSPSQVIEMVNDALATEDRGIILSVATELDTQNNLGCPIN